MSPARRFPPPWSIEEGTESFTVKDATGQALAYFYFENESGRCSLNRGCPDEYDAQDERARVRFAKRYPLGAVGIHIHVAVHISD